MKTKIRQRDAKTQLTSMQVFPRSKTKETKCVALFLASIQALVDLNSQIKLSAWRMHCLKIMLLHASFQQLSGFVCYGITLSEVQPVRD
jgi:hypothetical protein